MGTRWRGPRLLGGMIVAAAVAVSVGILTDRPAAAASTRHATLAVTGLVADGCPASVGGSQIFIKPGDTVVFNSTVAGIDLGLLGRLNSSLPTSISTGNVTAFDSTITWAATPTSHIDLPQGKSYTRTFGSAGTYDFGWVAKSITVRVKLLGLLGIRTVMVPISQNVAGLAGEHGSLSWSGQVVVTDKATQCGVSAQVPGVSVRPSAAGHPLPPVTIPGQKLPTIPVPKLPTGKSTKTTPSGRLNYTPDGPGVKERDVQQGGGLAPDGDGVPIGDAYVVTETWNGTPQRLLVVDGHTITNVRAVEPPTASAGSAATGLPMITVFLAMLMLSTATATYSRRFIAARH